MASTICHQVKVNPRPTTKAYLAADAPGTALLATNEEIVGNMSPSVSNPGSLYGEHVEGAVDRVSNFFRRLWQGSAGGSPFHGHSRYGRGSLDLMAIHETPEDAAMQRGIQLAAGMQGQGPGQGQRRTSAGSRWPRPGTGGTAQSEAAVFDEAGLLGLLVSLIPDSACAL